MDNGLIDEQSEELRKYRWMKETVIGKKNGFLREHLKTVRNILRAESKSDVSALIG